MPPINSPAKNGPLAEHPTRAPQQEAATPIATNRTSAPHAPSTRVRPLVAEQPDSTSAPIVHAPFADEPQATRRRADPSEIAQSAERLEIPQSDPPSHPDKNSVTISSPALHVLRTNGPHHAKKQARAETVLALHNPTAQDGHPPLRPVENLTATDLGELQNALRKPQPRRNRPQPQRKRAGTRGTNRPARAGAQTPSRHALATLRSRTQPPHSTPPEGAASGFTCKAINTFAATIASAPTTKAPPITSLA